jgi:hypothetical protein
MFNEFQSPGKISEATWRGLVGAALVVSGSLALIDQVLRLGWLAPVSVLAGGCVLLYGGYRFHAPGFVIAGWIICGFGLGLAMGINMNGSWTIIQRIGFVFLSTGAGFALISTSLQRWYSKFVWWPIIPLAVLASIGYALIATPLRIVDFALSLGIGLGLGFLIIGLVKKWIGMIIPGCILIGTGLGVYIPWGTQYASTVLSKTGTMLVLFGIGWVLIAVFGRMIIDKFIWWPLIPGGLQAVVGWGLFIGGEPGNAVNFIGNTGSIVILILGLYLLLIRRSIRQ